jgi:acyl-CoA thioesterase I
VVDEKGWLKDGYSADGLHPNAEGYKVMAPIVTAAIQKALP